MTLNTHDTRTPSSSSSSSSSSSPLSAAVTDEQTQQHHDHSFLRVSLEILGCAFGIYACFIGYGLLQERIYTSTYEGGEKFNHSLFLVFFQCCENAAFALLIGAIMPAKENKVPMSSYMKISFSYIGAMFSSNYALAFMSYPAQALAKSCKLIPVMLMRIIVLGKKYKLREYLQVLLITAGIGIFMLFEHSTKNNGKETSWFGLLLCLISLLLDGYTGPTQEHLNHQFKPSFSQMMYYLNFWAIVMVSIVLFLTGEMVRGIDFCARNPIILTDAAIFSLLSAMGQALILFTLLRFNSLIVVTITTTRKFFTILASVLLYGHVLTMPQWSGVLFVFAGLSIDIYAKYADNQAKKHFAKHSKTI